MNKYIRLIFIFVALVTGVASATSIPEGTILEAMPAKLETQYALSAVPTSLRSKATVYLLNPQKGYELSRQGTSGVACLVQRMQWEFADFRNDIYYPVCYDAAGTMYLRIIMDAAALRAQGMEATALKLEIEKRLRDKTYEPPKKFGLSYMIGPIMRTKGPPDMQVSTMAMPHLMFYAPYLKNEDIGAMPNLADPATLVYPFVDQHGVPEQSYIIQLIGATEKAQIMRDEKPLIDALCAWRDLLCLSPGGHH